MWEQMFTNEYTDLEYANNSARSLWTDSSNKVNPSTQESIPSRNAVLPLKQ